MYFAVSKAHGISPLFTGDKNTNPQFLVILTQIGLRFNGRQTIHWLLFHDTRRTCNLKLSQARNYCSFCDRRRIYGSDASRETIAIIQFFQDLSIPSTAILILTDSETALDIADGIAINHCKNQHIDIKYHAICHYIQQKKVVVNHTPSSESIADLFTKALEPQKDQRLGDYKAKVS